MTQEKAIFHKLWPTVGNKLLSVIHNLVYSKIVNNFDPDRNVESKPNTNYVWQWGFNPIQTAKLFQKYYFNTRKLEVNQIWGQMCLLPKG